MSALIASSLEGKDLANDRTQSNNKGKDLAVASKLVKQTEEALGLLVVSTSAGGVTNGSAKVSNTVPANLSLFQWESQVFKDSAEVFVDIQACLTKFEDIMDAHVLDLDANFARVIPPLLSATACTWYEHFTTTRAKVFVKITRLGKNSRLPSKSAMVIMFIKNASIVPVN